MDQILKKDEQAILLLRKLYQNYGYQPYKMSRFEEYDLYVRNKDFLVSDQVITFSDAPVGAYRYDCIHQMATSIFSSNG